MAAPTTAASPQQLIAAAKALLQAFNDKNWDGVKAAITSDVVYDEVATNRKVKGADQVVALWKGWAAAIPDSKATIQGTSTSGNMVIFELTWNGTHKGPLQTPKGAIPATGKKIAVRACTVHEIAGDKVKEERHYFDLMTLLSQIGAGG